MSEPGGSSGPSGQPSGNKRPDDSPANETNSSKKLKTSPAPSPTALETQKPASSILFGQPTSIGTSSSTAFGSAANSEKLNTTPQPSWSLASTATQTTLREILQQSEKTREIVQALANEFSEQKKQLEDAAKTIVISKAPSTPTSQQDDLIHAKGYLHCTLPLVEFEGIDLFVVLKGDLRTFPYVNPSRDQECDAEWGIMFFQKRYASHCFELDRHTTQPVPKGFPTFLLPLGEIFVKEHYFGHHPGTCSLRANLCMDITTPSKSLWIVGDPTRDIRPQLELKLSMSESIIFSVVNLVDDIRNLGCDIEMRMKMFWFMLRDSNKVIETITKSAWIGEYSLRKPNVLKLGQAISEGWAKDTGPLFP
ncbi:hypothetical protein PG990_004225 [Apiospora arundinis]